MATTTNYGWTTPDDTALVKDGASAIRSLGTAIDTTVFNNAGAAIAKTIVDAKGDIIAATAADTVSRLAVGANDTVLTADSSTATGLKWAATSSGGITLLSTTTLSGTSTQITGISQDYKNLYVIINNVYVNTADTLTIEIDSISGGCPGIMINGTTLAGTGGDIRPTSNLNTATNAAACNMVLEIYDYTNTSFGKPWQFYGAYSSAKYFSMFGVNERTSATDSLNFYTTNGVATFTAGTVKIYGVK
jgi:hypothetical protein